MSIVANIILLLFFEYASNLLTTAVHFVVRYLKDFSCMIQVYKHVTSDSSLMYYDKKVLHEVNIS